MIIIQGEAHFGEGELDRIRRDIVDMVDATRAEQGCLYYALAIDALEPNLLHVSGRWRDEAALRRHYESGHIDAFLKAVEPGRIGILDVKGYEASNPRTLLGK